MRSISCALGLVASLIAARAEADVSKAWAAAKDNLPASTQFVLAIDVAAIYKSSLFPKVFEAVKGADRDIAMAHGMLTKACGWDPLSVVDGVVVAGDSGQKEVAVYVQLTIDRVKASACLQSAFDALGKGKPQVVKQDGRYTVVAAKHDTDAAYFAWVGPNVVVITSHPDRKAVVDAWSDQKTFGKSPVAGLVAKLDLRAAAAGAFASDKPIDSWVPITKAYGNLTIGNGRVTGALVATAVDAKSAKSLVDDVTREQMKQLGRASTPAALKKLIGAISITAAGSEIGIKGSATEKELADGLGESFMKKRVVESENSEDTAKMVAKLDEFSAQMCSCKDKACADKVNDAMTRWGTDMAKSKNAKPDEASMKHVTDTVSRYADCMTKLMSKP